MKGLREAFEKQIESDPYDITTRKQFSDWLDEHTDEAELASFLRSSSEDKVRMGESYLKDLAAKHGGDFDDLVQGLRKYVKDRVHFTYPDYPGFGIEEEMESADEAKVLWRMFSEYTGVYYMPSSDTDGEDNPFMCCY